MAYPTDEKGRYIRIPTPLKREKALWKLIQKHKQFIAWYQNKLGLSDYGLLWLVFFKGIIVTLIVEKIIASF